MKKTNLILAGVVLILALTAFFAIGSVKIAKAQTGSSVAGKVLFEGTAPLPQPIHMDADPVCMLQHKDGASTEEVVVNPNGTLKNVFVYVKQGLAAGQKFEAPKTPVVFDQKGCHYEPHVFGIQVNQPFEIVNSDETLHNVHALPKNSKEFNLGMPLKGMKLTKTFTSPEIMVKVKCEVHPWMAAWGGVVDHPYFAVTGEDGSFTIKDLPPGEYTIEAWHEKYGTQTATVKVPDTKEVSFTFKAQ